MMLRSKSSPKNGQIKRHSSKGEEEGDEDQKKKEGRLTMKTGLMRKMKTMKRKFFVLSEDLDTKTVSLEYFDSEKKYESHPNKPKKTINISDCFSVNRRPLPSKSKQFAICIFTLDDCVSLILEEEEEMKQWLDALSNACSHGSRLKDIGDITYDHVWQVLIVKKGLGFKENICGIHRVCLTSKMLHVYRLDSGTGKVDKPLEFPLNSIRKCGHTDNFFSVELGRSSTIGAGELLMQTDDNVTAQVMHETIREAMKSEASSSSSTSRPRSSSSSDGSKSRRSTLGNIHPPHVTPPSTISPLASTLVSSHPTTTSSTNTASAAIIRSRCDSLPSRSRCISEGTPQAGNLIYTDVTTTTTVTSGSSRHRITSSSPPTASHPLSSASGACSTESVGSSCLSEEYSEVGVTDPHVIPFHTRETSAIPSQPSIREEETIDDYIQMDMSNLRVSSEESRVTTAIPIVPLNVWENKSLSLSSATSTSLMSPANDSDEYMSMNPRNDASLDLSHPQASLPASEESGYLSMVPSSVKSSIGTSFDQGYLNMAPQSSKGSSSRGSRTSSKGSSKGGHRHHSPPPRESLEKLSSEFPLAPVKSFFSPAEDPSDLIKPVRAYSIGCRPTPALKALLPRGNLLPTSLEDASKQSTLDDFMHRIRAHSMGSQGTAGVRQRLKDRQPTIEQQLGTIEQLDETTKDRKSSSVPVLDVNKGHRHRSSTVGARPTAGQGNTFVKRPLLPAEPEDHMLVDYSDKVDAIVGQERRSMFKTRANSSRSSLETNETTTSSSVPFVDAASTSLIAPVKPRSPRISKNQTTTPSEVILPAPRGKKQEIHLDYACLEFNHSSKTDS